MPHGIYSPELLQPENYFVNHKLTSKEEIEKNLASSWKKVNSIKEEVSKIS